MLHFIQTGMKMDLIVKSKSLATWGKHDFRCAVGRCGFIAANDKKEGDGATPIGRWLLREIFYRPDREKSPLTTLPVRALRPNDAWCENPKDPDYNRRITLPHKEGTDNLWRKDHLYDLVVVLGYNDAPPIPGKGSAIFLHLARPDFSPSAGCVTLAREDLLLVLREATPKSAVLIDPGA
jgi:L,D-peptidoglycan transpeptidase YkuD (ErfK/YbiS/YcfS/YnhG family)